MIHLIDDNTILFDCDLTNQTAGILARETLNFIGQFKGRNITFDFSKTGRADSAGVAFVDHMIEAAERRAIKVECVHIGEELNEAIALFTSRDRQSAALKGKKNLLEASGERLIGFLDKISDAMMLVADVAWFSVIGLFKRQGIRKGEFWQQSILIGMNSLPIVGMVSYLIGFVIALQSAAQLRQFGASIFIADLIVISLTREMGPLMTAIMFAGRSGSAIASEIATMVVSEETDALRAMALNPIRYIVVPKIHAITLTMPLLTILSIIIGVLGAMTISITYLDTGILPFYQQAVNALVLKDIVTGLVKSVIFAWIVVLTSAYYGFSVRGGAESVGRTTTAAVVTSAFLVVVADSILGLIFYFGSPAI